MTTTNNASPGRPPLSDTEPTRKATISMPESYWAFLESRSRNTSAAVRELIERVRDEDNAKKVQPHEND